MSEYKMIPGTCEYGGGNSVHFFYSEGGINGPELKFFDCVKYDSEKNTCSAKGNEKCRQPERKMMKLR